MLAGLQQKDAAALTGVMARALTHTDNAYWIPHVRVNGRDLTHASPLQRIAAGEEPEAIREWLVARYGDYITYTPRVTSITWPLFAAPLLLLALAALLAVSQAGLIVIQPFSWRWYFDTARRCKLYDFAGRCWTDYAGRPTSTAATQPA